MSNATSGRSLLGSDLQHGQQHRRRKASKAHFSGQFYTSCIGQDCVGLAKSIVSIAIEESIDDIGIRSLALCIGVESA